MTGAEFKERLFRWMTVPGLASVLAVLGGAAIPLERAGEHCGKGADAIEY